MFLFSYPEVLITYCTCVFCSMLFCLFYFFSLLSWYLCCHPTFVMLLFQKNKKTTPVKYRYLKNVLKYSNEEVLLRY